MSTKDHKSNIPLQNVIRTNKMHIFAVMFKLNYIQVFILWQFSHASITHTSTRLLIWMHERNIIKLYVQVYPRVNTSKHTEGPII